jgi:hypothetical protein
LQALAGTDQECASVLPQRHGHQAGASCRRARSRDELLMLALDAHLLIAELGDAAIGF